MHGRVLKNGDENNHGSFKNLRLKTMCFSETKLCPFIHVWRLFWIKSSRHQLIAYSTPMSKCIIGQTMSTHVGRQVASFNLTQKQYPSSAGWWILSSCTVFFILTWEEQEYKLHQTTYKYQLFSRGILGVLLLGLVLQPSQAATGICFAVKLVHCASASCKR
jgi:hypothetical protein